MSSPPLRGSELAVRIETVFHHRAGEEARRYLHWGGLCLDETGQRIRYGAGWLSLTPAESKVLALLFRMRGSPASKDSLCAVLGNKKPLKKNAVEVLIYRLRNRLRPLNLQISTLRGTGYVIDPLTG